MEGRRRVRIFHALRYRDFRLLFAGQTVSLIPGTIIDFGTASATIVA